MRSYDSASPEDNNGAAVPPMNVHPRLMTHRRDSDSRSSSARQTPRSPWTVPTNAELAEAGVTAQDGVVRQLSARNETWGSLAGPREMPSPSNSVHYAPEAITTGGVFGETLQFSEPQQRRSITDTAHEQQPQSQKRQPMYDRQSRGVAHCPVDASSSRKPIRPGRNSRSSSARSQLKKNDSYAHVTSVVHGYRENRITALEAQYKVRRSHSNASGTQGYEPKQGYSLSPRSAEAWSSPSALGHASMRHRNESWRVSSTSYRSRQGSPLPQAVVEEYRRNGAPRAALDAPHIRYAEALYSMNNYRSSSAQRHAYMSSMPSNVTANNLPDVATRIPDRFKYVPPTEDERRHRREATLRALEEWRERQRVLLNSGENGNGPAVIQHNKARAKSCSHTRTQRLQPTYSTYSASYASLESRPQQFNDEKGSMDPLQKHSDIIDDSRSGRSRGSSGHSAQGREKKPKAIRGAAKQHDDHPSNKDADKWEKPQFSTRKRSGTSGSRRQNSTGLRTSSRNSRGVQLTSARGKAGVNSSSFRLKLLFDVSAPSVRIT
ncbi:hypothetical protein LPMP_354450 [Leishmania panamensis]|uniref:Uncharacterized protein n=1 Tax=Leishmania panamensis TaxID=5679 RepID=A0A088SL94_LEIPA|nr:hypothetical protein LPMP_354450 [Leishmania panamensis]AIO02577.1 hypothetical protein LPMP_354450 [Leishmania panamensis]